MRGAAFTLAEVLITLGIIGVVAAITLPTIVANYKEHVLVNQVKKAYSEFQNALKLYAAQNSCSDIGCISDTTQTSDELANKLFTQFQGAYKCPERRWDTRTKRICITAALKSNKPYYVDGVTSSEDGFKPYFVSANGVAYKMEQFTSCPTKYTYDKKDENGNIMKDENDQPIKGSYTSDTCAIFYIDANGTNRGPNQFGADVYRFDLDVNGVLHNYIGDITPALTKGKLEYTPYEFGVPKN